jgi:hypothetical protein
MAGNDQRSGVQSGVDIGMGNARKDAVPGSGGTPGARPEVETPWEKLSKGVSSVVTNLRTRMNSTGSTISPSTVHDHGNPGRRSAEPTRSYTGAEEDAILNRAMHGGR